FMMKMRAVLVLAGLLVVAGALETACARAEKNTGNPAETARARQENEAPEEHPYLLITPERAQRLQERMEQNERVKSAWQEMKKKADRLVKNNHKGRNNLPLLGLAYQMTDEEKYAKLARTILLREMKADSWGSGQLLRRNPPWHAGLGLADRTYPIAIGFDAVYNYLSEEDRQKIADGLVRLGVRPALNDWILKEERIHTLDSMGHNWWSACVFNAGVGALSVMNERPEAYDWAQEVWQGSEEWFAFNGNVLKNKMKTFDRKGGFYEGPGYGGFAMREYLRFRLVFNNAFPEQDELDIDQLNKYGDFYLHTGYPDSSDHMSLDFGDSGLHTTGSSVLRLLIANGYSKDRYWWHLMSTQEGDNSRPWRLNSPFALLYYPEDEIPEEIPDHPGIPKDMLLEDMDWATMRSSWKKDATMLGVQSGYTWNHTHADAGSFILFHNGENLIIDSGNCSYGRPLYDDYFRQSRAHNVVLFNGHAQDPRDTYYAVKNPGNLHHLLSQDDMKYVLADNTGPTGQYFYRNYRHFLWIGDVILVIDDLWAHEPGTYEWLLHYAGKASHQGKDMNISKNGAQVDVRPLFPAQLPDAGFIHDFPEKMQFKKKSGYRGHNVDETVPYYAFIPPTKKRRTKFITAIILRDKQSDPPKVERLRGNDMIGVRIHEDGKTTDVYLNLLADARIMHRNSNTTIRGWDTDAYLTALTYPEGKKPTNPDAIQRCFVANGSYLRRGGQVMLNSLSKVYMIARSDESGLAFEMDAQPVMKPDFYAPQDPGTVTVNGQEVDPTYDAEEQLITLEVTE
ncbi:MAG: heparinase II/III family protein, partial [Planctomycetota bacterium]